MVGLAVQRRLVLTDARRVLRFADLAAEPWRDGGGVTRVVAAGDPGGWRVSIADLVTAGPFSSFPGTERIFTVASGAGVLLTVDGVDHRIEPGVPFAFDGGADVACRLSEPARAINVMWRRGGPPVDVSVDTADALHGSGLLVALDSGVSAGGLPLNALDSTWVGGDVRPAGDSRAMLIGVRPSGSAPAVGIS